ncbi:MAG: ATP-binding cassette domain-containing protein [Nitrososphaeria archaeon]|nr:ATP-binding cassette domain-containing protein [Nitrososphaeria archaeon]
MRAVEGEPLRKDFGTGVAVDGVSFEVEEGEVFGLLGPNGAGKTTTINVLTTLIRPTSGTARVMGYDVLTQQRKVRESIGLVPQELTVDDELTGLENLCLQAALYHLPKDVARRRIEEVIGLVDLTEAIGRRVSTYSGGMRKRLELAGALIHRPKVLFLDEPTLGLDVQTRASIWDYVKRLVKEDGLTVFMTTHYMEEADANCDRVAIIDRGQIKAIDSPRDLKARLGYDAIELEAVQNSVDVKGLLSGVRGVKGVEVDGSRVLIRAEGGEEVLPEVLRRLISSGVTVSRVEMRKPTLDEVFMSLTGRRIRDERSSKEEVLKQRFNIRRLRA